MIQGCSKIQFEINWNKNIKYSCFQSGKMKYICERNIFSGHRPEVTPCTPNVVERPFFSRAKKDYPWLWQKIHLCSCLIPLIWRICIKITKCLIVKYFFLWSNIWNIFIFSHCKWNIFIFREKVLKSIFEQRWIHYVSKKNSKAAKTSSLLKAPKLGQSNIRTTRFMVTIDRVEELTIPKTSKISTLWIVGNFSTLWIFEAMGIHQDFLTFE